MSIPYPGTRVPARELHPLLSEVDRSSKNAGDIQSSNISLRTYRKPRLTFRLWKSLKRSARWLIYFLAICVSDTLDNIFWTSPYDKKNEDQPSESDLWDDNEIIRRYVETPGLEESITPYGNFSISRICDDTVVKPATIGERYNPPSDVQALNLVRSTTDVLTPRVRRTIKKDGETYIVMEYIEGKQLAVCWGSLSFWTKLRIARTLRQYIRQLQKIRHDRSHIPGPLATPPRRCQGYQFGVRSRGPFPDYASLSELFNQMLRYVQRRSRADPDSELFDDSCPLVFTHNDLNMRNILLGVDGRVWLVDWEWSGFFPQWFEYVAMFCAAEQDKAPLSWSRLIPFMANPYFKQQLWMEQIGYGYV